MSNVCSLEFLKTSMYIYKTAWMNLIRIVLSERRLTQQKFILSQFWKPEVWSQCQWAKSKCQRLLLLEALQENPFFASLSFCWLPTFLGLASITPVSASAVTSPPSVSVWKLPLIPLIRIHTTALRDHPDNSGEVLHLNILNFITSERVPFP